jgi:3-oxoacyl-[acyl-carrier-protein] synthase II
VIPRLAAITGVGLALPGVTELNDMLSPTRNVAADAVHPASRIGRRGLRYKDRATQLALCAAHDALADAELWDGAALRVPAESVAVVASSNLGNLDTVCAVASTIASEGVAGISPMDLPNASSNVVASSVAIRFGLKGPNLMVCNGATSGLDAVYWAATLIAAGRAECALVIGVETRNEVVDRLVGAVPDDLLDGAVGLVLRRTDVQAGITIDRYVRTHDLATCVNSLIDSPNPAFGTWYVPQRYRGKVPSPWLAGVPRRDLTETVGRASGALGVLQCVAATGWMRAGHAAPVLLTVGDESDDASAGLVLQPKVGAAP